MATITAAEVNKLRQTTGAGMMDCKKALVEAEGDFDKAIEILRKKGQKIAANRQEREAKEGSIFVKNNADNTAVAMIELNCETDFVAANHDFIALGKDVVALAEAKRPADLEALKALAMSDGRSVSEHVTDAIGKIGEKIDVSKYALLTGDVVINYIHPGAKVGVLVALAGAAGDALATGRDIALQIAAMNPVGIDKDDVDAEVIAKEIEIGKEVARNEGKPEAMLEKIAQGKLNKFFKDNTLLNQEFIKDNSKTIAQHLKETLGDKARVLSFKRMQLGA